MSQVTLQILHNLEIEVQKKLSSFFTMVETEWFFSDSFENVSNSSQVNVIWIDMKVIIGKKLFEELPNLKFIVTPTTGLTHIDSIEARSRGIEIISLRGEGEFLAGITASSEFAWTLVLSVWRKLPLFIASDYTPIGMRERFASLQLTNKTIGIIGFGRIGKQLARYANSFGMKIVFFDIDKEAFDKTFIASLSALPVTTIRELCAVSDIVVIAASHREEDSHSYPLIGNEELLGMKEDAILINIARGSLIDEAAVTGRIRSGKLKGFGTDVLSLEEINAPNESPLTSLLGKGHNIIISPHIGGMCLDAVIACQFKVAETLLKRIEGFMNEV